MALPIHTSPEITHTDTNTHTRFASSEIKTQQSQLPHSSIVISCQLFFDPNSQFHSNKITNQIKQNKRTENNRETIITKKQNAVAWCRKTPITKIQNHKKSIKTYFLAFCLGSFSWFSGIGCSASPVTDRADNRSQMSAPADSVWVKQAASTLPMAVVDSNWPVRVSRVRCLVGNLTCVGRGLTGFCASVVYLLRHSLLLLYFVYIYTYMYTLNYILIFPCCNKYNGFFFWS